jgi:hypothetical protein
MAFNTLATVRYVNLNSANPTPPYTDWTTAATDIQDAIDASTNGDTVLVTNGVYASGGAAIAGGVTNRVALTNAITVQSVNGPWVTIIRGVTGSSAATSARCAWLTNNATLIGFTLEEGGGLFGSAVGGGVWCASSRAVVDNCVIVSNTANGYGGGVYQGTCNNCLISSNNGLEGAVYQANLNSCTIVNNGYAGVLFGSLTNCIVYYNTSTAGNNCVGTTAAAYCCTPVLLSGKGNFTNAPQLFADGVHLLSTSPCIGAGTNLVTGTDIFGNAWANPPSVGCAEFVPGVLVTTPQITLTSYPVGFKVGNVAVAGQSPLAFTWLQNGVPLQNNGHFSSAQTSNLVATGVGLGDAGSYQLVVSNATGVVTSAVAQLVVHCVDAAGTNPVPPYLSWATAATNAQDAIAVAGAGDIVVVTNGLYAAGGASMDGVNTNRVAVNNAILVQSVNGPGATVIQGAWDRVSTNGPGAMRCAWLTNNAVLSGFALVGGATGTNGNNGYNGGGVWGASTNAAVINCWLSSNAAFLAGGAAYGATLNNCSLSNNQCLKGNGGGAANCNLTNCIVTSNAATSLSGNGGGAYSCYLKNCAITKNTALMFGGGSYMGTLVNCTVVSNSAGGYGTQSGAVANALLTNCLVWGNAAIPPGSSTNYYSCTFSYSDTDPLPSGTGNKDVNPQLLGDGVHLSSTSPCIGAGLNSVVTGLDIDGQAWKNPPSIGCDEWQPPPIIVVQPGFQVGWPVLNLTFSVVVAGQTPFSFFWSCDGTPIQNNAHYTNAGSSNLVVNNFGPGDSGLYQVVVSNSSGVVTSAVASVVIHAVNAAGVNPVAPYESWAEAATNIQDAIEAAAAGDVVLVSNGIYNAGGEALAGNLTNRVALDKALMVVSVNGWAKTIIQGAWDPVSTNGPAAVRCAWLTNGAVLSGFTLQNGATQNSGSTPALQSGGGVWCASTNALVSNCLLSNNVAAYGGGGMAFGTLDNSLVVNNLAAYGGGAYDATLNNCTVVNNATTTPFQKGGGTYNDAGAGSIQNCIVLDNGVSSFFGGFNNYCTGAVSAQYFYCCTENEIGQVPQGTGNTNADPLFLDLYHIATNSPCRGAGSTLYASGKDVDGEPWNNPPSIGCDEVVVSNRAGPLSVALSYYVFLAYPPQTNVLVNHLAFFEGTITGLATSLSWNFGDGPAISNADCNLFHQWTNAGNYDVVFTAYNTNHPTGISASMLVHVASVSPPQLQAPSVLSNGFQFQFNGQVTANYVVQYATNLTPPVTWLTLQSMDDSTGGVYQIQDAPPTNAVRFYRVGAQ